MGICSKEAALREYFRRPLVRPGKFFTVSDLAAEKSRRAPQHAVGVKLAF
jgi:hypothetical protein